MLKIELSYRGLLAIVCLVIALWAFTHLWPVIILILTALILTVGLLPYVEALVRSGVPRTAAVLLILFAILACLIGMFSLMVPPLVREFEAVRNNLPESARQIEQFLAHFGINLELQDRARTINWNELLSGRVAVNYGQRVVSVAVSLITVLVMTAYLLGDMPRLGQFIGQFIPKDRKDEAESVFVSLTRVVGGYLRGQVITSFAIGLVTFLILTVVGVANPLAFAVLAAFADVIPLFGALIATVPPVAAALQESVTQALIVLLLLVAYQQFEDRVLVPRVYGRTLNLPPLIVLIAVLVGGELLGVTGVLLALPLTAAGRVGLDYLLENRGLTLSLPQDEPFAPDAEPVEPAQPQTKRRRPPAWRRNRGETSAPAKD